MTSDVIIEDDRWQPAGLEVLSEKATVATLSHLGFDPANWEICVMGCDDTRIAGLNQDFRDKPQSTNVLSWPSDERAPDEAGAIPDLPADHESELGDIAIALETCQREAAEQGKSFDDHVTHLLVHATLHLLGYDHIRDEDATLMEETEIEILGKMGISNPYNMPEADGASFGKD